MGVPARDFAFQVQRAIEALTPKDFHRRVGHAKTLREEWYAIARLGLHFLQPGLSVEVEVHGKDGAVDATISETGFREREFHVEVSCTYSYEEALRDELMVGCGSAPGAGPIHRRKDRTIAAEVTAVDSGFQQARNARKLQERFLEKCGKKYPPNTILLLVHEDMTVGGWGYWRGLIDTLISNGCKFQECQFLSVFIINTSTNELQQVK